MRKISAFLALMLALLSFEARAQGTLSIALQQQFSFSGCASTPTTSACGQPLAGGLLYFYQVGTVATPQNSFQDAALTILNQWPLPLDQNGRVPQFYLASGSIHVRLTDSAGIQQFDYPSALVIGPSGGGGGGSSVDPSTVASTGDMKFRITTEVLTGWVKMNGQTIGNAVSGATQRANSDTQALFVYLWNVCTTGANAHCPVSGGLGANGLADFNAGKTIQLPDCRGRICAVGLDDMGNSRANVLVDANVTGGDTATFRGAIGGLSTFLLAQAQLPNIVPTLSGSVTPSFSGDSRGLSFAGNSLANHIAQSGGAFTNGLLTTGGGVSFPNCNGTCSDLASATPTGQMNYAGPSGNIVNGILPTGTISAVAGSSYTISSINGNVAQQALLPMNPFMIGTYYMKL